MKMLKLSGTKCDKNRLAKNMKRENEEQQRSIKIQNQKERLYTCRLLYSPIVSIFVIYVGTNLRTNCLFKFEA